MTGRKVLSFAMASAMTMGITRGKWQRDHHLSNDMMQSLYTGARLMEVYLQLKYLVIRKFGKDWQKNTGVK